MDAVGKPIGRVGGPGRVSGSWKFVGDLKLPGMLHVKLVHPECGHARILSIDSSEALKVPGVAAVLTGADLPRPLSRFGPAFRDRPLMAVDTIQYHGEPVALVAAETEQAAAVAASLVRVEWEELPGVYTVEAALDPASPLVQDPSLRKEGPWRNTNTLEEYRFGWGDPDSCRADEVIENSYSFPMVTHFAIEPLAFLAEPVPEGMNIYTAVQNPFAVQRMIAGVLELPLSRVRIFSSDPGGAFGGKQHPKYEPVLAFFARKLGRPLRLELSLEETFQAVRRAAAQVRVRSGFLADGTLVFQDIRADYLIGAYVDIAARVVSKAGYVAAGPYRIPHVRIRARALFSHTLPSTAFRGFGIPQVNWAVESQMDAAAARLGLDRLEIRLKNLPEKGETFLPGDPPADGQWSQALLGAAKALDWGSPLPPGRGRGLAMGLKMGATTGASYCIIRLHMDGSATVFSGTSDMGQGARTIFSQMAAQELGIPVSRILMTMGDTGAVPFDLQTSASRSTVFMGRAVVNACRDIREKIRTSAAEFFGLSPEEVTVTPGEVKLPERALSLEEFLKERFGRVPGEFIGLGESRSEAVKGHPMGGHPAFYEVVCCAVELEVDRETGETLIRKMIIAGDVGKAINPQHVAMQDEGAAVMGLGHSVMEQYILDGKGRIRNLGALDYRIPTIKDIPEVLDSIHIENGDGPGPYGAKGVSEGGILAVAPSVAGAVEEAVGVRIRTLPLTPEAVWRALEQQKEGEA